MLGPLLATIGCSINLRQLKDYRGMGPVLVVGADTSTMTAYQLTRLLFIMLIFPYIAKGIVALYQRRTA